MKQMAQQSKTSLTRYTRHPNTEVENPNIGFSLDAYNMAAESRAAGGKTTASEGAGGTVVATNGNEATAGEVEWQDLPWYTI